MLEVDKIRESHLKFAQERGTEKTYCPSEVARALFEDNWRDKMNDVRKVADSLVEQKKLSVLQQGTIKKELPSQLIGPIRLQIIPEEHMKQVNRS